MNIIISFLRKFLRPRLIASTAVVSGQRRPLGYQQILAATLVANTPLTPPTLPAGVVIGYIVIIVEAGDVRWRDDGVAPTSAVGMPLLAGYELDYSGDYSKITFITKANNPILNVSYYA